MASEEPNRAVPFQESLTSAIRYWEPRRLAYNAALALVVLGAFFAGWPVSKQVLHTEPILVIFILAVLANVAYCAAYLPDLALQHSSFRDSWLRARWALLLLGTLLAAAITYLFVAGMFGLMPGGFW